jgi:DNA-binding CsgD family transcriptional regulator
MLIGRQAERDRIDALLARTRAGAGGALVVRGEPGIGKSALLKHAERQSAGMRVVHARGVEAEADLPFSGLVELLRPLLPWVEALPEGQAEALRAALELGPRVEGKALVGLATLSLLSAATEERPLLCLVDDAHWLDVASAEAFVFAARRLEDDAVAFLFGARVGEPRRFELPGAEEIELRGLSLEEGRELLVVAGHELDATVAERLHEAVHGNPLALLELPPALAAEQREGAQPLAEPLPVTQALQQAFARRVDRLPGPTRSALVVAAAEPSGRMPPVEEALASLGLQAAALEAAEDDDLLELGSGLVSFRHPLVRAAAYHAGRPSERRRAHRALAKAAGKSRDADAHAWHLAAAAVGADETAAAAVEAVAERSKARGTLDAAAEAFERAAALSTDPEQRVRRLCRAVRAYARIRGARGWGRGRAVVAEALRLAGDSPLRDELGYWEAHMRNEQEPARAYSMLIAEAARLGDANPALAALLAAEAATYVLAYRDLGQLATASAAARVYARQVPARTEPYVVMMRALALIERGRLAAAAVALQAAADTVITQISGVVSASGDYVEDIFPIMRTSAAYRATMLVADPRQLRALGSVLERVRSKWAPVGDRSALMVALYYGARIDYEAGRWNDARAGFAEAEQLIGEFGENERSLWYAQANLAQLAAARGAEADCRAYTDAADAVVDAAAAYRTIHWTGFPGTSACGLLALGRGEHDLAIDEYERKLLPSLGPFVLSHELADAIEAYVRAGRCADAEHWLAPYTAQASESGWPWARARAAHLALLLAHVDGIDAAYSTAIGLHGLAGQPFPRARTELVYGERLRRARRGREARSHLRAAVEAFDRLGARPWAEHAAAELRATGERIRRRGSADISELTPQELQVALAISRGATNREAAAQLYLSPKTIEKHLGSAYRKLGVSTRAELGARFASAPATDAVAAYA